MKINTDDTEALIKAAFIKRGVALKEKKYTELSTYYAAALRLSNTWLEKGTPISTMVPKSAQTCIHTKLLWAKFIPRLIKCMALFV